jgi:outer membrane protein assembly factor BamB
MLNFKLKIGILISMACCLYSCSMHPDNSPYQMFRGNVIHSGTYQTAEVKVNPGIKWKFKTNGYVNSSPAMEDDRLYFGSGDGYLYCVNAANGTLIWKFQTGGPVHSSPAVVDGEVFFGSHDGNFYALDSKKGNLKWTFKTEGEKRYSAKGIHGALPKDSLITDEWDFWLSSPAIAGNSIYFGSGDGIFYALNKTDGKPLWKFKTDGVVHSSPAIAFGNVYFGGWDTYLHALNAETGKEVWKFKTGEDTAIFNQTGITSSPVIDGNILYFGCRDSHIYALDAVSGKPTWKRYNDRGWISVAPVISGDKILYGSGSDKKITALNKLNGDSVYQYVGETGYFSSFAVVSNTFYYGDMNGYMHAREINTGKTLWKFQLPTSKQDIYHILKPDGSIDQEGFAKAVEQNKGTKKLMEIRFSIGGILSSPIVKDGVMYFGATDGYFYALQ